MNNHTNPRRAPLTKALSCSASSRPASLGNCAFITPKEFVDLISDDSDLVDHSSVPILDCRSQIDFGCERIRSSHNINCRAKIMARKLASKRLEDLEPNLSSSLNNSDKVILYDQSSDIRTEDKIESSPINLVVQAAQKSNKKVHIIQGGIEAVKTEFPHLIEYSSNEKLDNHLPSTPEPVDKENFRMTEVLTRLFVGNVMDAQNLQLLNENRITHILNCTPDLPLFWQGKYQYLRISVLDTPSQNIRSHFETAIEFIENALKNEENSVLVHCSAGISRSPTLVLAYIMKIQRMSFDDAFEKMRRLRSIVDPNVSFIIQLRDWEKSIDISTSTNNCTAATKNSSSISVT